MKDTEVRIGNLVYGIYENENGEIKRNICRIMAVDETSSLGEGWNFLLERVSGEKTEYYDDTEPLPLSEEMLINLPDDQWVFVGFGNRQIWQHTKCRAIKFEYAINQCFVYFNDEMINVKCFVHEIQNIWHSLTGEELEFKL